MKTRIYNGYVQARSDVPGQRPRWQYIVLDFGLRDTARILATPAPVSVPIDAENRLTIDGRRIPETHWRH